MGPHPEDEGATPSARTQGLAKLAGASGRSISGRIGFDSRRQDTSAWRNRHTRRAQTSLCSGFESRSAHAIAASLLALVGARGWGLSFLGFSAQIATSMVSWTGQYAPRSGRSEIAVRVWASPGRGGAPLDFPVEVRPIMRGPGEDVASERLFLSHRQPDVEDGSPAPTSPVKAPLAPRLTEENR
jgi:hypothetical protein